MKRPARAGGGGFESNGPSWEWQIAREVRKTQSRPGYRGSRTSTRWFHYRDRTCLRTLFWERKLTFSYSFVVVAAAGCCSRFNQTIFFFTRTFHGKKKKKNLPTIIFAIGIFESLLFVLYRCVFCGIFLLERGSPPFISTRSISTSWEFEAWLLS